MLDGVKAQMLLFAGTQIYRYLEQEDHNNSSVSISLFTRRSYPPPPPLHYT